LAQYSVTAEHLFNFYCNRCHHVIAMLKSAPADMCQFAKGAIKNYARISNEVEGMVKVRWRTFSRLLQLFS